MNRYLLLSSLFAATAMYAQAADPVADACARLLSALEKEVAALEVMQQSGDVIPALGELQAALKELAELSASVDEKELWQYIDNTEGKKQPLVDVVSQLALEFSRIEAAAYFDNAELRTLLAPQTEDVPEGQNVKLDKIRAVDHDDD